MIRPRTPQIPHILTRVIVALVWLAVATLASAQAVRVPGTGVSLVPPEGFVQAQLFPGFQREDLGASIMVTEVPGPMAAVAAGLTKDGLARQGMTLIASSPVNRAGGQAILLHLRQQSAGQQFLKWMLVGGDETRTIIVVGTFPAHAGDPLGGAIETSVLTASWGGDASTDPFEGLLFRVTPNVKLRLALRMSNMLLLSESGTASKLPPDEAVYIIGTSVGAVAIDNVRAFTEARARQTAKTKNVKNLAGRPLILDGLDAYELVADAQDASTGTPLKLYLVIAPDVTGYFIAQGLVGAQRAAEVLPEFRRVTQTFSRTR